MESLAMWAQQLLDQLLRTTRASQSIQVAAPRTGSAHKVKLQDRWVASVNYSLDEVQRAWIAHKLMVDLTIQDLVDMDQHKLINSLVSGMSIGRKGAEILAMTLATYAQELQQDARHRFSKRELQKYISDNGLDTKTSSELRQLVVTLAGDRPYEATDPVGLPLHPVWTLMAIEQLF